MGIFKLLNLDPNENMKYLNCFNLRTYQNFENTENHPNEYERMSKTAFFKHKFYFIVLTILIILLLCIYWQYIRSKHNQSCVRK